MRDTPRHFVAPEVLVGRSVGYTIGKASIKPFGLRNRLNRIWAKESRP